MLTFVPRLSVLKNLFLNLTDYSQDQIVRVCLMGSWGRVSSLLQEVELLAEVASLRGQHVATCSPLHLPPG